MALPIQPPRRISHVYRQHLDAPPSAVFPLLCPTREAEWVEGWAPRAIYSFSGFAETDCVFITPAEPTDAIWVVTDYDPAAYQIGFVKVTPDHLVVRIHIALHPADGDGTFADIRYTYTALGPSGEAAVEAMTTEAYSAFMRTWEAALNGYLQAGKASV